MKIEKGVPVPVFFHTNGRPAKYNFEDMEIGDSVFDEGAVNAGKSSGGSRLYMAAWMYGRRHGKKFVGRKVDGGVRIWRSA